jgi:formate hydrogenlyase subunit 3/multisubunit Na+/H+ antiporter MnhD subunit
MDDIINFIGFCLVILNMLLVLSSCVCFIKSFYCLFYDRTEFFSAFFKSLIFFFLSGVLYYVVSSNAELLNFEIVEKVN